METHPLRLTFCANFFTCTDSLARDLDNRPSECLGVTPDEAQVERTATGKVHKEFEELPKRYLETTEEIGKTSAQRIKAMSPMSSKMGAGSRAASRGQMHSRRAKHNFLSIFIFALPFAGPPVRRELAVVPWTICVFTWYLL